MLNTQFVTLYAHLRKTNSSDGGISDKKELLCVAIKQIPGNKVKPQTLGRSVDKSYFTQKIPYAEQVLYWAWYYIVDEASVGMKNNPDNVSLDG